MEALASVRCASFIAQSMVNLGLTQSYVASGHPRWLDKFFVNEKKYLLPIRVEGVYFVWLFWRLKIFGRFNALGRS